MKRRRLDTTNEMETYNIQTHLFTTSKALPIDRTDVQRRTIHLEVEPASNHQLVSKDALFEMMLAERPRILAEVILRCQNILRAYQLAPAGESTQAGRYGRRSEMFKYEVYCYHCAVYEGTLAETQAIWSANREQYTLAITDQSPIVHAMRLFIGKQANTIPRIGITELFSGMQNALFETGQNLPYKPANKLGQHLKNSRAALATVGVTLDKDAKVVSSASSRRMTR
jgi:hypothetical protein